MDRLNRCEGIESAWLPESTELCSGRYPNGGPLDRPILRRVFRFS
jgi:hypothetical protein